jgi:outer membrane receptor for ferrienterochelin and colicins
MKYIFFILIFVVYSANAQKLNGQVKDSNGQTLPGAVVYWQSNFNDAVISDLDGKFSINKKNNSKNLIIRMVGFNTDTIWVKDELSLIIILKESENTLQQVVVQGNATIIDRLSAIHTEVITAKSLAKAACCNLSESFETNGSVSVNYTDAVTGSKQIQLLGLSGTYVQTNIENIPNLRGLATTFGLNYVPGTWIESIDVAKGVGSVINGYENMAGAINVELKKPDHSDRLYVNAYANQFGRAELNINSAKKINKKWSTAILSHGSFLNNKIDNNGDGFLDLPKYNQINLINRWKYNSDRFMGQFGVKFLKENRIGGQVDYKDQATTPNIYGFENHTRRVEFFSKTAILFPDAPYRGLGLIISAINHNSDSRFGNKPYVGIQNTLYSNLIYQDKIGNTNHTYKTGLSFMNDNYDEKYAALKLKRNEIVPGAFFEYTFNHLDRTLLILGLRDDYHNLFGNQFTPRLHFKQDIGQNDTYRFSVGRGFRVPNPLAEYFGNLVSSRNVVFLDKIQPEVSWNFSTSYYKTIGKLSISAELYHNIFTKQWVADMEHPGFIYFYGSENKPKTTSGLIEVNYGPVKNWELKMAYRYVNSKVNLGKPYQENVLVDRMFLSKERVLFNVAYALPYDKWKIDGTLHWNGKRRIPNAEPLYDHTSYADMPVRYAPSFVNLNAQITRNFVKWEYYLGGENLTGFKQSNPIIEPNKPFGNGFDAGMAWGPIVGATIYTGVRFKLI